MPELHDLVNEWREGGCIRSVKWHTVNDDFVCDICRSRSEKEFLLDEVESLMSECDNCRCWVTPIVDIQAFGDSLDFTPEEGEYF
ncbi:hypothetical protein JR338_10660 [Chloroflexota bacterium]|nr:hypothetical protein JR338_10660 [Chloroflexota bacterium]